MSGKALWCLVGILALTAGPALGNPYDRVAYYDAASGVAWAGGGAVTVRDALQQAGYKVLDAAGLKTWMDARISDKKLSVVVMCQDVVPTTVAETEDTNCTIRRYLDAGGKVVWYSDWPFYYCGTTGTTWGSNGAVQVLGFNAATGPNDQSQLVTITDLGRRWGLTTPWTSRRPTSPTVTPNLDVLAKDNNGNAAGWVKHYVTGDTFRGFVRIDDRDGAPVNMAQLMAVAEYYVTIATASGPVPSDGATDVPRDAVLSWTTGQFPSTHDVYFGTVFADVNSASRTSPKGVLASKGQADTTFDPPGVFAYGQTYYWRIDEVNKSADATIFKGGVWSFTAEPYGYPITKVTATASSTQPGMGPENTINGSGLTGDLHGTDGTTMWLSTGAQPNWIQYQFDNTYKLNDLKVWNSNQMVESFLGFGAKDVKIEYSTDGTAWTALANVPQFARAPGLPNYAANTTVSFGGVMAKYVKLTINSTWGGLGVTGLSEVRFSYIPVQARSPVPATGATGQNITTTLNWRPGREAASHKVFFGANQAAVTSGTAPAKTVTDHTFDPGVLTFGTTYYWRVDEVNAVSYPGDVWSFTTQEFAVVDDFESYNDDKNRIYDTWIDGLTDGKSGSTVGYLAAPFAEQTIVHGGKQSMPLAYDNTKSPFYSEATRTFDTAQDWTGNGADTLSLYFRGRAPSFLETTPGVYVMGSGGTDIWNTVDQFRFACKSLSGNGTIVARVDSEVAADPWTKAGVMIRESLAVGAKFAAVYATPGNGVRYQARLTADVAAVSDTAVITPEQTALTTPVWVKIERIGSTFNGYYSTDGAKWTAMSWNPQTITMTAATVYIGLAVTAHSTTGAETSAQFSNVATTGNVTGSWQSQLIGLTQSGNDPGQLYVTVQDSAGKSKVVNYTDLTATTATAWQEWRIGLSQFTSAGVKVSSVKKLMIGVGDRSSPKAGGAGMLFLDDIGYGHPAK